MAPRMNSPSPAGSPGRRPGARDGPERRLEVAVAVAVRGTDVLVGKRPRGGHLPGFWEFPGGKIETHEVPRVAALRELREETGLFGGRCETAAVIEHDYADRAVRLHVFIVYDPSGEPLPGWSWRSARDVASLPMPPANRTIVDDLVRRLAS